MKSVEHPRITTDPDVLAGKPIIAGTRISVEHILRMFSDGETKQGILQEYPHLTGEDIDAALAYGAERVSEEKVFPVGKFHYV